MHLLLLWAILSIFCNDSGFGNENWGKLKPTARKETREISSLWLWDLEKSYKVGFAQHFRFLKYRNKTEVPNHNIPRQAERKCHNVSFFSFEQNRRMIDQFGYESVLNSTILDVLVNPRARLFQFQDHWGEFEDYHFLRSERLGMCTNLIKLQRRVNSVFTFGKCVRLFEKDYCKGWSMAIYPGCSNSHRLEAPRHVKFQSIGPCLENEFSRSFLNESMPDFVIKNPEMRSFQPDLSTMFNPDIELGHSNVFGGLRVAYLLGPRNRTEIIVAGPRYSPLDPAASVEEMDFDISLEKEDGDVLGHAIPITIGGPANEVFNIFPANQLALNTWEDILLHTEWDDEENLAFSLQFEYENEEKTRPLYFYYSIKIGDYGLNTKYGRIINEHYTNMKRDKPYRQAIPVSEYKGTVTINLTQNLNRLMSKTSFSSHTSLKSVNRYSPAVNWSSCKHISVTLMRDKVFKENVTQPFLLNTLIQGMVRNPMVRLFEGKNLTGDSMDYHSGQKIHEHENHGCYPIYDVATVESAETFGTCIRLFEEEDCKGLSLAIYGRSGNSHETIEMLKQVESMGPCLEDEFINGRFIEDLKGHVVKDPNSSSYFPDLVQFGGFTIDNQLVFRTIGSKSIRYGLGPNNRIEYILNWIDQVGIAVTPKTVNVKEMEFYKSLDKKWGDVPCYAVPLDLNGPGNESFNIFPISKSKVDDWARIYPPSSSDPNEHLEFNMELHFVYKNVTCTRPDFIYYHFYLSSVFKIYYGRFNNL